MNSTENGSRQDAPLQELENLDELWFQVGGTLCNLSCNHCFISCHPGNDNFGFMDLETIQSYLRESQALGVKEYYFTGGEPFLNRDMLPVLEETLAIGPATVLTNGTVFTPSSIKALQAVCEQSLYSLELRVSIDGYSPETNDPIRGEGTFEKALAGVKMLVEAGFLPIITMAQTWPEEENTRVFDTFAATLKEAGYQRPRIKILPTLHLGMEAERSRPYSQAERINEEMMEGYDSSQLLCSRSRTVTDRGVAVCPLLIEAPGAHLGDTLEEASGPFRLDQGACYTCYVHGAICSNIGGWGVE
ncbi:MAG: radical SAM protein [Planctomycetota bacterium]|nr:radical SAM protein [Planctomycetota bacterium]